MARLFDQVSTYLEAEGFTVSQRGGDLLVGTRRALGEETEYYYVWVPEYEPTTFRSREGPYLSRFQEVGNANPSAHKYMVVPSLEGLSTEFRAGARQWHQAGIRSPVQFFDTDLKWEVSPQAASVAKDLKDRGVERLRRRVPQPYQTPNAAEPVADLLGTLGPKLRNPGAQLKNIHVVIGPAGIGKSYLFDALFAELHDSFLDYKNRGGPRSPRPLPLLPQYLPLADSSTIRSLLTAYLQTDFARPLRREVFEWMMSNGFAVWMLDGLDEVISQDPAFFDYLLDLMTLPGAQTLPSILVCVRDSLLATNEAFREFCEEYQERIVIYQLDKWSTTSKRRFAEISLGRTAEQFITTLRERPSLDELASTPYYCSLLSDQFSAGRLQDAYSEASLLDSALRSLIDRDYGKGFVDKDVMDIEDVIAFLEGMAEEDLRSGFRGVPVQLAQEWADTILPADCPNEKRKRLSGPMVNLGAFGQGTPGHIRFAQEVLEHYLLGRSLVRLFENQQEAFVRQLALRELPKDWVTMRLVVDHIKSGGHHRRLNELVYQSIGYPTAFKNMLQISAMSAERPEALRNIPLERRDLSGIVFQNLDFHGVSFRECNLSDTEFHNCNLKGADLSEAVIKNTAFLSLQPDALQGAQLGDLCRFYSMRVDRGRRVTDHAEARKWFQQRTGARGPAVDPCVAALQLRHFFNKFVSPDGKAKRSWLDPKGMVAGRRFHTSPENVLNAAKRHGYLREEERYRGRIHRPEADLYPEFVAYATSLKLTPGIKAVLDDVCEGNCPHVTMQQ